MNKHMAKKSRLLERREGDTKTSGKRNVYECEHASYFFNISFFASFSLRWAGGSRRGYPRGGKGEENGFLEPLKRGCGSSAGRRAWDGREKKRRQSCFVN
jgi:hypothetical protein